MSVAGTPSTISAASFTLVANSIASAPSIISPFLSSIEKPKPMTWRICSVSLVMREEISPVRETSKKDGDSVSTWAKAAQRRSAMMRSPTLIIR